MSATDATTELERPHAPRWGRLWTIGLLLALATVATWEGLLRARGFRATVPNTSASWAAARASVGARSTVLLGTSRMLSDVDPEAWRRVTGGSAPVHLGLTGASPVPVLEELAESGFGGVVVVDIVPLIVFDPTDEYEEWPLRSIRRWRDARPSPAARAELALVAWWQGRFVSTVPELSPLAIVADLIAGRRPTPAGVVMTRDRFRPIDFEVRDAAAHMRGVAAELAARGERPTRATTGRAISRIEAAIRRIHGSGGEVVLVRLPSCGAVRELEDARFPRASFWDRLVAETGAPAVHSDDHPVLADFPCRDGSHLDYRDAPAFTRALVRVLETLVPGRIRAGP